MHLGRARDRRVLAGSRVAIATALYGLTDSYPTLGDDVRAAAERSGESVSAWLARAAAAQLRKQALANFLASWQAKHGRITEAELVRARVELQLTHRSRKP